MKFPVVVHAAPDLKEAQQQLQRDVRVMEYQTRRIGTALFFVAFSVTALAVVLLLMPRQPAGVSNGH
jgi:hypothetical protein